MIDLVLCLVALASAYLLRFNFQVPQVEVDLLLPVLPIFLVVRGVSFLLAGVPRIMVRHTSTEDARRLFLTVLAFKNDIEIDVWPAIVAAFEP